MKERTKERKNERTNERKKERKKRDTYELAKKARVFVLGKPLKERKKERKDLRIGPKS
jgi:hypothetical protein